MRIDPYNLRFIINLNYRLLLKNSYVTFVLCLFFISMGKAETLIDYFLPMPIVREPLRSDKWGCSSVGDRDIYNGLEDTTCQQYCYWDGPIIKGPDGKYHMFASRWEESGGHWAWLGSVAVHAVSDDVMGPYVDKGMMWPHNENGKGHNVTILKLDDGTYASVVSDTRPGDFFAAPTLDGPWTFAGSINIDANGYDIPQIANLSIIIRPDNGRYMIVARNGQIMISSGGLTGPYVIQGNSVYNEVNLPNLEDPVLWYSGGLYHIVVNSWSERKAYHLTSEDGVNNWKNQGLAFNPNSDFLRYTDGTVNHWNKIERPGVVIENGHVTHFTFSVIDVEKEDDLGNDGHGSKVIVVPFKGVDFDGVAVPANRDTIYNGTFDAGDAGWTLNVWDGSAEGEVFEGEYRTTISSLGTENHQIQLVQSGLALRQGESYRVSFDAYASANRTLEVNVEMDNDPWTSYLTSLKTFDLETTKASYSFIFKMEHESDSSGRLVFNFGASTNTVFLDNVAIEKINETGKLFALKERYGADSPSIEYNQSTISVKLNNNKNDPLFIGVFDLNGKLVKKSDIKSGQACSKIDIKSLSKGIYVVGFITDGKISRRSKLIHRY